MNSNVMVTCLSCLTSLAAAAVTITIAVLNYKKENKRNFSDSQRKNAVEVCNQWLEFYSLEERYIQEIVDFRKKDGNYNNKTNASVKIEYREGTELYTPSKIKDMINDFIGE